MAVVQAHGPLDARVLWVGEAPGKDEVLEGRPFVGKSGRVVRNTLKAMGIDPDVDVRWTNACRINPGTFPVGDAGAQLLMDWAPALDADMRCMPNLKVIVACGTQALRRLTGLEGINNWQCSVLRNADVPSVLHFSKKHKHFAYLPEDVVIIPVLHPAGIMRSKGWDDMAWLRRGVDKVRRVLRGQLEKPIIAHQFYPNVQNVLEVAKHSEWLYFDTEFNPETKDIYWIDMTFGANNGEFIYGMPWEPEYVALTQRLLEDPRLMKCAHNIHADAKVLHAAGIRVEGEWWDSMIGMHALHPALDVGLDDAARYYLDDVKQWKGMDKRDPVYNAYDVAYGAQVMLAQWREAKTRKVDILPTLKDRMALLKVTLEMEQRGMPVNVPMQQRLIEEINKQEEVLKEDIAGKVRPYWDLRVREAQEVALQWRQQTDQLEALTVELRCEQHPKYLGVRKQTKKNFECPTCCNIHESYLQQIRPQLLTNRKSAVRARMMAERWEGGFEPGNNEHLRWLLYDPQALALPIQRHLKTKEVTADRTAIDKLIQSEWVQRNKKPELELVKRIKEVQQLQKARSTFLQVPMDKDGYVHPPYKVHGTRTGRLAGGSDDDERADNTFAFNALNVPKEWRAMYVPPADHVFVAADWRNVEGRLTAHFCKDPNYQAALDAELTGGHKVHAINAGIIYNIDPADAETYMVDLGGQQRPAYDGGKRLTHAWSYGMQPRKMMATYGLTAKDAARVDERLSQAYPLLVQWRQEMVARVLGVWERLPQSRDMVCTKAGQRWLANPFGWQLHFLGPEHAQANEVIAFMPQSTGASMWTRVAPQLAERYPLLTGTYDSFVMIVPKTDVNEACAFLKERMEQPWAELDNKTFPCEVSVGMNWGEYHSCGPKCKPNCRKVNQFGLRKVE